MSGLVGTQVYDVTPSDSDPVRAHKGILIGGDGNLNVVTRVPAKYIPVGGTPAWDETTSVIPVTAGKILPISVYKILAATTATNIQVFL